MPIKTFETFYEHSSLDTLKNTVIGIDIQHYLTSVLPENVDSTFEAIGGFPISLESIILNDIESFNALGMKPIFVFPGLKTVSQFNYLEQSGLLPYEKQLQKIWESKKANPTLDISFRNSENPFFLRLIMDQLLIILQNNDVEFLISPFSQFNQLYYMWKTGIINCIYSSNDLLLIENLDNFIIGIDFKSNIFHYLENKQVLHNLNLNFKQFRDIAMCLGNSFQPFQLITTPNHVDFSSLMQSTLNGSFNATTALSSSADDKHKLDRLINGCSILDYCPVLKINGRVEAISIEMDNPLVSSTSSNSQQDPSPLIKSLSEKKIPSNLIQAFGVHLPDELFFYQSIGFNIFHLAEACINQNYAERLPLDMTTDSIYEKIIFSNASMKYKETILNLITTCLHRYIQNRKLVLKTYFKGTELHNLDFNMIPPVSSKLTSLVVRHTTAKSFDLPSVLSNLNDTYIDESTFAPSFSHEHNASISSNHEIISTALLRSLYLYNFIKGSPFKLSEWGITLSKYIHKYNTNFETTLLLFILFQRFPDLDIKKLSESQDLQFNVSSNEKYDISSFVLISKFATLFKIQNYKPANYTGIVSNSLLHFNSCMCKLHDEIRDMVTVNALVILFGNRHDIDKYTRDNNQWTSLATEIPFKSSMPNTIAGLLVAKTIETFLAEPKESFKQKLGENLSSFNVIINNPVKESLKALKFVLTVCDIIESLAVDGLVKEKVIEKFSTIKSTLTDIIALF
ncbi:hypothetical protein C6P40_004139 [Pichia californica]|uniref:XPG N-terminal domain-containing protein n=1 Tax=Pichia californica TaxID=460514 RepID=A0A9P6WMZ9_9ASCO|nr:hypothetical protein C6P42_003910 [[Candida] californica]KAG0689965.1 hypothetical protein C6P40_004139 [[Candida] californica]